MKCTSTAILGCFLVTLALGPAGCKREKQPQPSGPEPAARKASTPTASGHQEVLARLEPIPEGPGKPEMERWFAIKLQDRPAGKAVMRITRHQTPRGLRRKIHSRQSIAVRRGSMQIQIESLDTSVEDAAGKLVRYRHTEWQAGGERVVVEAGKLGDQMVTVRGPEISRVAFEPKAREPQLPYRHLFHKAMPRAGEVEAFRSYTSQTGGYTDNRLEILEADQQAGRFEARHTTEALPGVVVRVVLDRQYLPVSMETGTGSLVFAFEQTPSEPGAQNPSEAPDLGPMLRIPVDTPLGERDAIELARYRIAGLPSHVEKSWLTGPGQQVVEHPAQGTFVIEVRRQDAPRRVNFPIPIKAPVLTPYLEPTALAQADDPELRALAGEITEGAGDMWTAARRLRRWVTDEIESDMGMAFAKASEVLDKRKGDCSEQALLLATMARAAGIPARCVVGLVYHQGVFARHMWTEVWAGDWRALDPAMGTDRVGPAWIRIGDTSLRLTDDRASGMGGLTAFVSDIAIEVLEVKTSD